MKRRSRLFLLGVVLILLTLLLSGCVSIDEAIHLEETTESARYYLYRVNDQEKYLKFLENFDEDNFEIVDISISYSDAIDNLNYCTLYCVTYKRK